MPAAFVDDSYPVYNLRSEVLEEYLKEVFPNADPKRFKITVSQATGKAKAKSHRPDVLTFLQEKLDTFKFQIPRLLTKVSGWHSSEHLARG